MTELEHDGRKEDNELREDGVGMKTGVGVVVGIHTAAVDRSDAVRDDGRVVDLWMKWWFLAHVWVAFDQDE